MSPARTSSRNSRLNSTPLTLAGDRQPAPLAKDLAERGGSPERTSRRGRGLGKTYPLVLHQRRWRAANRIQTRKRPMRNGFPTAVVAMTVAGLLVPAAAQAHHVASGSAECTLVGNVPTITA